ncbi:ASKHA domain-containing protein [Hippea jasoniae]|uniref:ASKHA domain-containing protein n=1 Tax=Hippea jasoniae TaxID=944479 RepID=UPI0009FE3807|nr:ASKHA domain-containing protein [Hippea jasoniae]
MKLTVVGDVQREIEFSENENLLKLLAKNGIFIEAYCGGRGICRKCQIKFIDNAPPPFEIEKEVFSHKQLEEGYRLACLHKATASTIKITKAKGVVSFAENQQCCCDDDKKHATIDIGTTTIAISLIENGKVIKNIGILNPQIPFGADVISRITYSDQHGEKLLSNILNKAILETIKPFNPSSIVVCANPTMLAFFLCKNPHSIGTYPYKPLFFGDLHTRWHNFETYIPPVVSAFVGSDITAGLILLKEVKENYLFIDIGTNCEFVIKYKDSYFAASVPAGPALEGSGIDYGTIAKEGAITSVDFDSSFKVKTINNKKATGITGSGLISAIALLRRVGFIDKDGRLLENWEAEGDFQLINRLKKEGFLLDNNIFLTQKSIREFQLVKASLAACLDILFKKLNIDMPDKVFIAGGFSKSLTKRDLIDSGLLPFDKDFVMLSNSSIAGGNLLFCEENRKWLKEIAKNIQYIEIANEEGFESKFIEKMAFDE